ncbi:MafI family immunity protein [Andreprevotia chitinilytica]|uniref:MafI family immunity protein n=1 Tax=Andreprevotia chitinilytica TaxID=396808 RepID=UPI000550FA8D|nr:MafI family immunity protein [Andreprevotia chitinilytica]
MLSNDEVESCLIELLPKFSGRLPDRDLENARDLIEHREWGVGLELLCTQLDENDVVLSADVISVLGAIAGKLNVDISYLKASL